MVSVESIDGEGRDRVLYQSVEVSEQLSSIQTMLRILLNDRRQMKEEPSSARSPKRKSKARAGKQSSTDSEDQDSDNDDSSGSSSVSPPPVVLPSSKRNDTKSNKARKLLETMVAEQQQQMAQMSSQLARLQSQVNTAARDPVYVEPQSAPSATPVVKVNLELRQNAVAQLEEEKVGAAWPQKHSSSSSEFVFDPDPNFLLKINNNIRVHNERVAVDDDEEEGAEEHDTPKE